MNSLDTSSIVLREITVASDAVADDADFGTTPATAPTQTIPARSFGFYAEVGPRKSSPPLPATSHLAPNVVVPRMVKGDLRLAWLAALTLSTFAGAAGFSAWLILVSEVAW